MTWREWWEDWKSRNADWWDPVGGLIALLFIACAAAGIVMILVTTIRTFLQIAIQSR